MNDQIKSEDLLEKSKIALEKLFENATEREKQTIYLFLYGYGKLSSNYKTLIENTNDSEHDSFYSQEYYDKLTNDVNKQYGEISALKEYWKKKFSYFNNDSNNE